MTVVGGSSPATIVLLAELQAACRRGAIGPLHVTLNGRNAERLNGILRVFRIRRGPEADRNLNVAASTDLPSALAGAQLVVVQFRPGGMAFRAAAEELLKSEGLPADEGLGPGGLAGFLRARAALDDVATAISRFAPTARVLMMTGPLGLAVDRYSRVHKLDCVGVCELASDTADAVRIIARKDLDIEVVQYSVLGLNHQSWIYELLDSGGSDRTDEITSGIDFEVLTGVNSEVVRQLRAVPVRYLRLYYHTREVVAAQAAEHVSRGRALCAWFQSMDRLLCNFRPRDLKMLERELGRRSIHWYQKGLLPVLAALCDSKPTSLILNAACADPVHGLPPDTVLETNFTVHGTSIKRRTVCPLPDGPSQLMRQLVEFEFACRDIPDDFGTTDVTRAIKTHPFARDARSANKLASRIVGLVSSSLQTA